jgi:hypothetical protein
MEHGTQLSDESDAHDMRAVNPQEFSRVELRREIRQRLGPDSP